jgi:hypothetical protein
MRSFSICCLIAFSSIAFSQTVTFSPSQYPNKGIPGAQADLNGDGILDIVSARMDNGGKTGFYVTLSNSSGGYNAPVFYGSPYNNGYLASIALGDFNGDGKVDVVEVENSANYYVFLNKGDGTFYPSWNFSTPGGFHNTAVVTADFNRDGKLDLVLADDHANLKLLYGTGHGTFSAPFKIATNSFAQNLYIGDYDSDGNADLAVTFAGACPRCSSEVAIYYGDGRGDFSTPSTYSYQDDLNFVSDNVDGNPNSDLIAENPRTNQLNILHGNRDRTFTEQDVSLQNPGFSPVAADFNGDGIRDIALIENPVGSASVAILLGKFDGSYQQEQYVYSVSESVGLQGLLVGRYNHDTKPDLVAFGGGQQSVPDDFLEILTNTTTGNFPACNPPNATLGIAICSPIAGSTVTSPVRFSIAAAYTSPLRKTELWIDGGKVTESFNSYSDYSFLDESFGASLGSHRADVYSAGYDNRLQHKSFTFIVGSSNSLQYDVSLFIHNSPPAPVGQVTVDASGVVTVQLNKAAANTTFNLEFCPAPSNKYPNCFNVGNLKSDGSGSINTTVKFPSGSWAGDFELFANNNEVYATSLVAGSQSVYYATLQPQATVNGQGTWTQPSDPPPQDPLWSGFVTLDSSGSLDTNLVGTSPNTNFIAVQCDLFQGSDCYSVGATGNGFTTDIKGNATNTGILNTGSLPEDIFYIDQNGGNGFGFIGGFKIP